MVAISATDSASTGPTSPSIRPPSVLRRADDHPSPTLSANWPTASTSASTSASTPSAWASPRLSSLSFLSSEPHARTSASTRASTWSTRSRSRSRGSLAPSSTSPAFMPGSSTFASSLTAPCSDLPTTSTTTTNNNNNLATSMLTLNSKHRSHAEPLSGDAGIFPRSASHKRSRSRSLDRGGAGVELLAPGRVSPRPSHIPFPRSGCTTAPSSPCHDIFSTSLSVPASSSASTYASALSSSSSPLSPVAPPTTSTSTYSTPVVDQLGKPLSLAPPVSGSNHRPTSPNRFIPRDTSTRTGRRDKRRSRSVSDLYYRPAEMGLGLSFEQSVPAPTSTHNDEGTDYFTLGMSFHELIQVSANSLESALFKLTLAPKPVTHLLMPHVQNPELEQFLEEYLPVLAPSLLVLKINDCQLTKLPPALELCTQLEELDISRNPLGETLPSPVKRLKSLRVLLAEQVGLASLPDWLAHCEQLKVLSASHNSLTHLPSSLHQLAQLERLILDHNPWSRTWAPVLAAIVNGPAPVSQSDFPLASQSSVALDSTYGDDEAEDAPTPPPMPTKTPPRIFSALRTKRSVGDLKIGTKSSRSSLALSGLGATRKGGTKSSAPNTPTSTSKPKGRQSNGSSDAEKSDRSKWSFSLRRGKGFKLEPPPLPFSIPRRMSGTPSSSTLKPLRQPYLETSTSVSNSTTALASSSTAANALAPSASTPLTPLDVKRFSGLNFWEEFSRPIGTRTALTSPPMAFRSPLPPEQGLAGPLSFLPVAHSTPPVPTSSSNSASTSYRNARHSRHSRASDDDELWTHRQAVEHRVDIKHLLTYLRDMYNLQLAQRAYETAATASTTTTGRKGSTPVSGFPLPSSSHATPSSAPSDLNRLSLSVYDLKRQDDPVYRRRVIEEIVASEETYVRGMQELSDIYLVQAQQSDPQTGSPVVPLAERQVAFGNLPALLNFHANMLLPALQAAAHALDTDPTALDAAEQVAEVFVTHASYFCMYTDYVNNCDSAQSLVAYWDGLSVQPGVESRLSALLHANGPQSPAPTTRASSEMAPSFSAPPGSLVSTSTSNSPASTLTSSLTSASLKPTNLSPLLIPSKPLAMMPNSTTTTSRGSALSKSARKARQKYLRRCAADVRRTHISIESYLLLPVQRVPRYCLLLEALVKVTPLPPSSSTTTYSSATSRSASGSSTNTAPSSCATFDPQLQLSSNDDPGTALDDAADPPTSSPHNSLILPSEAPWIAAATALASAIDAVPDTIPALEHSAGSADLGTTANQVGGDALRTVTPSNSNDGANHPSAGSALDRALIQMRELAQSINESKRNVEQNRRLVEWQAKIAGSFPSPLVQPHRRLVRDGVVVLRKIARLTTEPASRSALGLESGHEVHVPVLQQTVVEQPVVLLLCNDLAVFLQATSESLPMLRAAGQDAAAHAAITEAVASTCSLPGPARDPDESPTAPSNGGTGVSRPPPPDSAGRLLQAETPLVFELFAILRTGSWASTTTDPVEDGFPPGPVVERLDKTTIKVMDHSKLFVLSAQSAGDADAWMTAFDRALD